MGEFQERFKVDIALFDSTGSTTEKVSDYYDMRGVKRADFILESKMLPSTGGPSTLIQQLTMRILQATDSTGGGASAISSATAVVGKNSATGISTAAKMREGWIRFSTIPNDAALTLTVGTAAYVSATSGSAAHFWACAASDAATVGSEGFVTMFNSTVNNTATAITANWVASTWAGGAFVRIAPKDHDATAPLHLGTTGSSVISVGGVFLAHVGVESQFMGEGKRYIAVGVKSTNDAAPYSVTLVREKTSTPVTQDWQYSKSMNQSTSK